ncbi:helicase-related protein [Bifidobacterium saguinibicoloris]|uniref:helicase-related protein n=1 Tax=Bifidobacterium saguinibicoloris TaxID=2834433 RepID=UPI001C559D0E|nr:helicase-related protein [Bifidobacterium saguinibicoloris]MBW3079959.1 hypothetical protein [Bifidobacterium saguinibicoloris]
MTVSRGSWNRREKAKHRKDAKDRLKRERTANEAAARDLVAVSTAATDPFTFYSSYRHGSRRFTIHVGPTNSGKTHDALEALKSAGSGAYLAPLRLLALETGERLRAEGLPTDIITGEERSLDGDGRFVSQTIGTLRLDREYACVVIDEAQMIADPAHGGAWTRAILGVNCPDIHVCCAPEALAIVESLIAMCGDRADVVRHDRSTPLLVETKPWDGTPREGDAIIEFSRHDVLRTASAIEEDGIPTAIVYGALPWAARRAEARRFASGEAKVLVATDAIGMGMNLPIRRIVFGANRKFDGMRKRMLDAVEVRQIAGRAGRLGMFDKGLVTSDARSNAWLEDCLTGTVAPISKARVPFPLGLGLDDSVPLTTILKVWANAPIRFDTLERERLNRQRAIATRLETIAGTRRDFPYDRHTILTMSFLPADEVRDMDELVSLFRGLVQSRHPMLPGGAEWRERFAAEPDRLGTLERDIRILTLRYAFADALGLMDEAMDGIFAVTRERWDRAVIDKVAGPKASLLGSRMYGRAEWDDWDDDEDPYTDGAWRF